MNRVAAFRLLASADRQLLLHTLVERDGEASLDRVSREVAARRHRLSPDSIGDEKVERAHVRLVHAHLPYLEDSDIVTVDWDDRTVAMTDNESCECLFDAAEELESWPPEDLLGRPATSGS